MNYICIGQRTAYCVSVTLLTVGVDKDPRPPEATARGAPKHREHQNLLWDFFFGLYSVLTAASIVGRRYEIWE